MHIEESAIVHDVYDHIYLAPHPDDAALSCGGTIAQQRAAGARVLVVTICTAAPQPGVPFSNFAHYLHQRWGLAADEVVRTRLLEDRAALELLGADSMWAGMEDAIYRRPDVYTSRESLLGTPTPDDLLFVGVQTLICALRQWAPRALLYAPLGIGNHVDHQLVSAAARTDPCGSVVFYEDFPYVTTRGALERRLDVIGGASTSTVVAIDRRSLTSWLRSPPTPAK